LTPETDIQKTLTAPISPTTADRTPSEGRLDVHAPPVQGDIIRDDKLLDVANRAIARKLDRAKPKVKKRRK